MTSLEKIVLRTVRFCKDYPELTESDQSVRTLVYDDMLSTFGPRMTTGQMVGELTDSVLFHLGRKKVVVN